MIELRNEARHKSFYAILCKSKTSGHHYIHIGSEPFELHGIQAERLEAGGYLQLEEHLQEF